MTPTAVTDLQTQLNNPFQHNASVYRPDAGPSIHKGISSFYLAAKLRKTQMQTTSKVCFRPLKPLHYLYEI